jgi:hypothetical protein
MGWETSDRRERLPDNWFTEIVPEVRRKAGGRCQGRLPSGKRCPRQGSQCDHKTPGDDHSWGNLQWLCKAHHDKKSSREGYEARMAVKRSKYRPREEHPGTVR